MCKAKNFNFGEVYLYLATNLVKKTTYTHFHNTAVV